MPSTNTPVSRLPVAKEDAVLMPLPSDVAGQLQPVATESIVQVDGRLGIFTPLAQSAGAPPDPKQEGNLEAVIAALRKEVVSLEEQNQNLEAQLKAQEPAPVAPDDFAAALQQSLDRLQTSLAGGTNPVSSFAVKEFRLETNVHVGVTSLGAVEYRFPKFNEMVEARSLSRLTLQLVPIPRQTTVNVFTPGDFQPQTSI